MHSSGAVCVCVCGRPGLPVPNSPYGLCGRKATLNLKPKQSELRSCVKVEVAVLGSPSLIVLIVSVDVKQHERRRSIQSEHRRDEEEGDGDRLSQGAGLSFASGLNSCFSDIVFVTLLRTAVETTVSEVHKLLRTGGVPTSLTVLYWQWLTVSSVAVGRSAWTSY